MLVGMAGLSLRIEASPDTGSVFLNSLSVDVIAPGDVSDAVLYLASDESQVRHRPDHDRRRRLVGPLSERRDR